MNCTAQTTHPVFPEWKCTCTKDAGHDEPHRCACGHEWPI